jgi:DNA-binding IscR family transcriptional regulator
LAIILAIAIPMKDSGQCSYQSFDTIAKITGLSKTIMIRVVRMLEMKGLVSTHGGRGQRPRHPLLFQCRRRNRYTHGPE